MYAGFRSGVHIYYIRKFTITFQGLYRYVAMYVCIAHYLCTVEFIMIKYSRMIRQNIHEATYLVSPAMLIIIHP